MPQYNNALNNLRTAFLLGLATLVTNVLSYPSQTSNLVDSGNLFLFMSAGCLGVIGAAVALIVGVLPEALLHADYINLARLACITLGIGYVSQNYPRLPAFSICLAVWIFLFAPLNYYLATHFSIGLTPPELLLSGLAECLLAVIAGVLLLHPVIWGTLTHRPRYVTISHILIHSSSLLVTLAVFVICISADVSVLYFKAEQAADKFNLVAIFATCAVLIAPLLGWRLAHLINSNFQELFVTQMLSNGQVQSFSGLSSNYWRRQSSTEITNPKYPRGNSSSSADNLFVPTSDGGFIAPNRGIVALTRDGTITFINRRFLRITEVKQENLLGKKIDAIGLNPQICNHIMKLVEETAARGPKVSELKLNQLPDALRFFEITSQRADSAQNSSIEGSSDGVIITIKDITDRRTVESRLLQGEKLASLGDLVMGIAHAFNNALTTITGQASYAMRSKDQAEAEKAIKEIARCAHESGGLVRQLLDFAQGQPSTLKATNLTGALESKLDLLKKIVGDNYELVFSKSADQIGINCDINLITQALTNLVLNARESYSGEYGKIIIDIETETIEEEISDVHVGARPGKFVRLRVKDEGRGMTSDVLSRAFDPLFTTKSVSGHSGLGLSIVFAIVRAHDGFLSAESHPGHGTTISLYFPWIDLQNQTSKSSENQTQGHSNGNKLGSASKNILVVEDDENVRKLVAMMLKSLGHSVTSCTNGKEALEKCNNTRFDLLLVDMMMPKMHGLEFINKIKESIPSAKALIMTGYGSTAEAERIANAVIPKPFDIDQLDRAIRSCFS